MSNTTIAWTGKTWNPVTGCTKVSQGCKNCYAEKLAKRLQAMGQPHYANGFRVTLHPDLLDLPAGWKKPARIFVNSMSDLFHPDVPDEFIERVFVRMLSTTRHTYQVLTKRADRMQEWTNRNCQYILPRMRNIWIGVSVENQETADERILYLLQTFAAVRFVSAEPLLGPLDFGESLTHSYTYSDGMYAGTEHGIDWVIVGGESGPNARPMDIEWARSIRDQCRKAGIAFFMKQLGGRRGKRDKLEDLPEDLRIREYPQTEGSK